MAHFDMLTKMFRTALASSPGIETANMLQLINIELEELDHDGRRSTEKKRKRCSTKTFAVCPYVMFERQLFMNSQIRRTAEYAREPGYFTPYSIGSSGGFTGYRHS